MALPTGVKPNPAFTPMGLQARKQQLIQKMTGSYQNPMYRPFGQQQNIPGQQDLSPPIQSIYTGFASGAGQQGVPAAQMSSVNPNIQALANVRGSM